MIIYIAQYKPNFATVTEKLKVDSAEYLARLQEKISAVSSIEEVNRQIDNLYLELKLVDALNLIFSEPQKNFVKARQELLEKLNRLKIPRTLAEKFQPELKNIFKTFLDIVGNSVRDFEQAALQIESSAENFKIFFDSQFTIFSSAAVERFQNEVDAKILDTLYNKIPRQTFSKNEDVFWEQVARELNSLRQNEKLQKFFAAWKNLTNTDSPADWSNKNQLPILCAFQDCLAEAQSCFDALNKTSSLDSKKIDAALKFLQSDKLQRLNDKDFCEKNFINYFGENYSVVLNAENLREVLKKTLGNNVYTWYSKKFN